MRDEAEWLSVVKNGSGKDGGQRPIGGYWHLQMNEQVEVRSKDWVKLSGEEGMEAWWCSLVRNKWKLLLKNGVVDEDQCPDKEGGRLKCLKVSS